MSSNDFNSNAYYKVPGVSDDPNVSFDLKASDALGNKGLSVGFKHMVSGQEVYFKAYITAFNETYNSAWTSEYPLGRMDGIHMFKNTARQITLGLKVPGDHQGEAFENLAKIQKLAQFLYPGYTDINEGAGSAQTIGQSPLIRLKVMNLMDKSVTSTGASPSALYESYKASSGAVNGILGFITSLTVNHNLENVDMSAYEKAKGAKSGATILPRVFEISLNFTPIHEGRLGWSNNGAFSLGNFPYGANLGNNAGGASAQSVPGGTSNASGPGVSTPDSTAGTGLINADTINGAQGGDLPNVTDPQALAANLQGVTGLPLTDDTLELISEFRQPDGTIVLSDPSALDSFISSDGFVGVGSETLTYNAGGPPSRATGLGIGPMLGSVTYSGNDANAAGSAIDTLASIAGMTLGRGASPRTPTSQITNITPTGAPAGRTQDGGTLAKSSVPDGNYNGASGGSSYSNSGRSTGGANPGGGVQNINPVRGTDGPCAT